MVENEPRDKHGKNPRKLTLKIETKPKPNVKIEAITHKQNNAYNTDLKDGYARSNITPR